MKVFWFTNIQLPAVRGKLGMNPLSGGGWMESLREALEIHFPEIELGITSCSELKIEPFHEGNVTYFSVPVKPAWNRLANIVKSWKEDLKTSWDAGALLASISQFNPDIIHVHGSENPFGLLAGQTTSPVVVSLQGLLTQYLPHQLSGLRKSDMIKALASMEFLKGRGLLHTSWRMRPRARREMAIMSRCRHFIGRTEWDKAFVKRTAPQALYYHCDELLRPEFNGSEWEASSSEPGRLFATLNSDPRKGLLMLIDVLALLRKSGKRKVRLRIAGEIVDTTIWPIVKRRLGSHGLSVDSIEWLGPLASGQIVEELLRASIFIHPSAVDNSPNSLCEAMMVGTPCVASAVGGVPSLIKDETEGLLFSYGDAQALAGQVIRLLVDKTLAQGLSKNARASAQLRHDPTRVAARMIEIYRSIIHNP